MASQFQNRLVGTIIIVALGVIVIPSLFDGKKTHYEEPFAAIPLVPKEGDEQNAEILPSVNHNLPLVDPALSHPDQPTRENGQAVAESSRRNETAAVVPTTVSPPVGLAYVIQLAAMRNTERVNELVALLRLSGYQVYTEPAVPVKEGITRLMIGPNRSKQTLEQALPELKRLTGLDGQVKEFKAIQ